MLRRKNQTRLSDQSECEKTRNSPCFCQVILSNVYYSLNSYHTDSISFNLPLERKVFYISDLRMGKERLIMTSFRYAEFEVCVHTSSIQMDMS